MSVDRRPPIVTEYGDAQVREEPRQVLVEEVVAFSAPDPCNTTRPAREACGTVSVVGSTAPSALMNSSMRSLNHLTDLVRLTTVERTASDISPASGGHSDREYHVGTALKRHTATQKN